MNPPIVKLDNPIQPYAWGSREAIARLQGRSVPTPEPEAELWIGDHPVAPSRVREAQGSVTLPVWIARDPAGVLGAGRDHLPFLAKVLAAACSLSIQVHPDGDQARRGWQREEQAGLPDERRSYRDPNAKHEVLVALTRFEALCGFREDAAVERAIGDLAGLRQWVQPGEGPLALRLMGALRRLDATQRRSLCEELAGFASGDAPEAATCRQLLAEHPGDPLAAAPFILEKHVLAPGQALVVRPGTVHSYLSGTGVEVMTRSDNVVRAGLTPKYIDAEELQAVTAPVVGGVRIQEPAADSEPGVGVYDTGTADFGLCSVAVDSSRERPGGRATVVLCVEGRLAVSEPGGEAGVELSGGEAALVPARVERFQLAARGTARVFEVSSR